MRNGVQLITYPDSLGISLAEMPEALRAWFPGAFSGVHVLPFYPSSGDRGFAPTTYKIVDPAFGTWGDIRNLTEDYDVTADFMVNHLSRQSPQFSDFLKKGSASVWSDLFLPLDKLIAAGQIGPDDTAKIYTRKPREPWITIRHEDGTSRKVWCTFSDEQIDLDVFSSAGQQFITENLHRICSQGIRMLRLDAFAYAVKKLGTSCFFVEPEVWKLLAMVRSISAEYGVELLPEVHESYAFQLKLAEKGYWVYDFALPMLVLHTIYTGNTTRLKKWLQICPRRQITTLDTHDGIGIVDVVGLLSPTEIEESIKTLYQQGSSAHRKYSASEYNNLDLYQINCTYYSALGENDDAYLAARAVQFFAPGIPQVYYVGALAGRNDTRLVQKTKLGRDINRHVYSREEVSQELRRPVVQQLLELMRFRTSHPAFNGSFQVLETDDQTLVIRRQSADGAKAVLLFDAHDLKVEIQESR